MNLSDFVDKLPPELFAELQRAVAARSDRQPDIFTIVDRFFKASQDLIDLAKNNYTEAVRQMKSKIDSGTPADIVLGLLIMALKRFKDIK